MQLQLVLRLTEAVAEALFTMKVRACSWLLAVGPAQEN